MKPFKCHGRVILALVWVFVSGYAGIQQAANQDSISLEGMALDSRGKGIGLARVVITPGTAVRKGNRHVVYSGSKGVWKADIPKCSEFFIQAFTNARVTAEKKILWDEWHGNHDKINLVLTEGLSHILWGSFEHIQLYVPPHHQKNIESLIRAGDLDSLTNYMNQKIENKIIRHAWKFAGFILFENSQKEASRSCFERSSSKLWFNLMGEEYMKSERYIKALGYYQKGETTRKRAEHLLQLAEMLEKKGDLENAKRGYRMALADFQLLLGHFKYKWDNRYLDAAQICIDKLRKKFGVREGYGHETQEIRAILDKAGKYCDKLDKTKMYYFCHEHKYDRIFLIKKLSRALENPARFFRKYTPVKIRGTRIVDFYKYDLQFVKEINGIVTEKRKLLLENLNNRFSGMTVFSYSVREPVHGPNTLVGYGWQGLFSYKKISEEKFGDVDAVVLEATHRVFNNINRMSGKIWIDRKNGKVLKIEWHSREIQNRDQLRAMGFILEREPRLRFVSEYGVTRSGFLFPSRCWLKESYVNERNEGFVRATVDIDYKNYNFFMVSSQVEVQ